MEENTVSPQLSPLATPPQRQPNNKTLISLVIFLSLLLAVGAGGVIGYWIGQSNNERTVTADQDRSTNQIISEAPPPAASSTPLAENEKQNWTTYRFEECSTTFRIPPSPSPTDERYWQVPRGGSYPNLLNLVYPYLPEGSYQQVAAMYVSEDDASGFIPSAVVVTCAEYRDAVRNNQEILTSLEGGIRDYNQATEKKGMGPESYTMTSTPEKKWGLDVIRVQLNEDEYYTFSHNGKIYEIRAFGMDSSLDSQQREILDSLSFE